VRILDLFCGAGGAAMGYHRAFPDAEIIGVDIAPQPHYPFEFVQADAMAFAWRMEGRRYGAGSFGLIHASPPCQAHTTMSNRHRGKGGAADSHDDYIASCRWWLTIAGSPYVIENVPGARRHLHNPITLSGGMFGLGVERPRLFECSFPIGQPPYRKCLNPIGVYGKAHDGRRLFTRKDGSMQRAAASLEEGSEAMGIDWMEWRELAESVPPAYTHWIGAQLAARMENAA
jgi:DNA (cytosine-5)-methyltransferase 1